MTCGIVSLYYVVIPTVSVTLQVSPFMTKRNYEEMKETGSTEVFVPLLESPYEISMTYSVYHPRRGYTCSALTPWGLARFKRAYYWTHFAHYKLDIPVLPAHAGKYKVHCVGKYLYTPMNQEFDSEDIKSLKLTFIKGIYRQGIVSF